MEVRVIVDLNMETGEYEVTFKNISNPGESMEYSDVAVVLQRVLQNLTAKVDCKGEC